MGNITETGYFEKLQEESEQMNDTMQEDEKLVFEEQFGNDDVSTDIDLDRDIPDFEGTWKTLDEIWEPEYLGDR